MANTVSLNEAMRGAVHVTNDVDLKTAVKQKKLVIISSDANLYKKMLTKFPQEKVSKNVSKAGKGVAIGGAALTIATGGLLGLPLLGAGLVGSLLGKVSDDYEDYAIRLDYDARCVQFIKVKGKPRVKL